MEKLAKDAETTAAVTGGGSSPSDAGTSSSSGGSDGDVGDPMTTLAPGPAGPAPGGASQPIDVECTEFAREKRLLEIQEMKNRRLKLERENDKMGDGDASSSSAAGGGAGGGGATVDPGARPTTVTGGRADVGGGDAAGGGGGVATPFVGTAVGPR